jgi:hypothetical protein
MRLFRLFIIALAVAACSEKTTEPEVITEVPDPTAQIVLTPDTATLTVGDSMRLTVTLKDISSSSVTFISSNTDVATVSGDGRVTARSSGSTLVIAKSTSNPGAEDATLIKVNVRPSPNTPLLLRSIGLGSHPRGFTTGEVVTLGDWAYTTSPRVNQTLVWNISSPQPVLVDSLNHGEVFYVGDAHISDDGTLLLISTDYGREAGLSVYSLANPAKPVLLDRWFGQLRVDTIPTSTRGTHTAKFGRVNGKLYIFAAYVPEVVIIDASNPRDLRELTVINSAGPRDYTHDVLVRDGLLFTADWANGVGIWDVGGSRGGTPAKPVLISRTQVVGTYVHNFWWMQDAKTGSKAYLFVGEEGPGFFPVRTTGDVHVLDISDLNAPREVAFFHVEASTSSNGESAGAHNFHADEDSGILYAAFYNGGIRAIDARGDLSNCTAQERALDGRCDLRLMGREVGRSESHSTVGMWGVSFNRGRIYGSDMIHGLRVFDASGLRR